MKLHSAAGMLCGADVGVTLNAETGRTEYNVNLRFDEAAEEA